MLLTDDEIYGMYSEPSSDAEMVAFARAVEAAILAKLASAELPEPSVIGKHKSSGLSETGYTADQLRQAYAQGAASQLAEKPSGFTTPDFCNIFLSESCAKEHGEAIPLFTLKEPK